MRIKVSTALRILIVLVASATASVQAGPLLFTTARFDTTAFAIAGGAADLQSDASPTSPLPLISSAVVIDPATLHRPARSPPPGC
jgi:hypothetical protein